MQIGSRTIGTRHPPYVIAEIGVNHDGSPARALELVDAAAEADVDAIKLQYFEAARLLSRSSRLAEYQRAAGEQDPVRMLNRLELDPDSLRRVVRRAHHYGLHAIVTIFNHELVPEAETLRCDAYKTASPDIVNKPLLDAVSTTAKPVVVSTGASTLEEVRRAVRWLDGHEQVAILQCVSSYPTPRERAALGGIVALAREFSVPVGYSDHTTDLDMGALAVGLGASILEKHLTYDTTAPGPDHAASLDPAGLREYVRLARNAYRLRDGSNALNSGFDSERKPEIGPIEKVVLDIEQEVRDVSRQSLATVRELAPGDVIGSGDVTTKRPGSGIEPFELDRIVGRTVIRPLDKGSTLRWDDLEQSGQRGGDVAA